MYAPQGAQCRREPVGVRVCLSLRGECQENLGLGCVWPKAAQLAGEARRRVDPTLLQGQARGHDQRPRVTFRVALLAEEGPCLGHVATHSSNGCALSAAELDYAAILTWVPRADQNGGYEPKGLRQGRSHGCSVPRHLELVVIRESPPLRS